jgi:uncharacterized protein (TIGR02118 family)
MTRFQATACVDTGSREEKRPTKRNKASVPIQRERKEPQVPAAPVLPAFANLTNTGVDSKLAHKPTGREAMAHVVVMYKTPKDTAAFDKYYFETHVPIAKKIPGLRKYEVSKGPVGTPAGPSGFHLVATLHFDDLAAVQAGFGSPEGKAAGADVPKFATGGADMLLFDNREV